MPRIETHRLNQTAVLYMAQEQYTDTGTKKVSAAVEVSVRWEEKKTEMLNDEGERIALDAVVVVDRDVTIGSLMWLGAEDDLPDPVTDLYQVVMFPKVPNIRGSRYRRRLGLRKYSDSLPPTAS